MKDDEFRAAMQAAKDFKATRIADAERDVENARRCLKNAEDRHAAWSKTSPLEAEQIMKKIPLREKPLDIVECGRRNPKKIATRHFAAHVVSLADGVIRRYMPLVELEGIRHCIQHQLQRLEWYEGIGIFPLFKQCYRNSSFCATGRECLLAESVISSTLMYRNALDEGSSGLRFVILRDFLQGLEWVCFAAIHTSRFDDNQMFPVLDSDEVSQFINMTSN